MAGFRTVRHHPFWLEFGESGQAAFASLLTSSRQEIVLAEMSRKSVSMNVYVGSCHCKLTLVKNCLESNQ